MKGALGFLVHYSSNKQNRNNPVSGQPQPFGEPYPIPVVRCWGAALIVCCHHAWMCDHAAGALAEHHCLKGGELNSV